MTSPDNPSPTPPRPVPSRPAPQRPDVVVRPLRVREEPTGPSRAFAVTLWVAVAVAVVGVAAAVAFDYSAVRSVVESSVAEQDSTASASSVADTVTVTLLGSGAVALVLLLVAALGLSMLHSGRSSGRVVVMGAGVLTAVAGVTFWSFMSGAGSIAAGVLQWGPLTAAALAVAATIVAVKA